MGAPRLLIHKNDLPRGILLAPIAASGIPLWIAWQLSAVLTYDDAYITLTYAKNIAQGKGFVYNGGTPYLGTTTPLLALLLGGLESIFPGIGVDTWALWVGTASWIGAIWIAFALGKQISGSIGSIFAAITMATLPTFPHVLRAEFPLLIFFSLAGLLLTIHQRYWLAGALFGLAYLTRGDAAILAGVTGIAVILERKKIPWSLGFGFLSILIPWSIYAQFTFGSPLPATLAVKRAHRALGAWPPIVVGFWQWLIRSPHTLQTRFLASLAGTTIGVMIFYRERNVWGMVLVAWGLIYAIVYIILNVPFYGWYATTLMAALALGASLGLARIIEAKANALSKPRKWQDHLSWSKATWLLVAILFIAGAWAMVIKTTRLKTWRNPKIETYLEVADWLRVHTQPQTTIGFIEVGTIAFFSERQIIDLLGLVTPGVTPYLAVQDNAGLFKALHPEYYIRNCHFDSWGMNRRVHESTFFQQYYVPIASFSQQDLPPVVLYRRFDVTPVDADLSAPQKQLLAGCIP